MILKIKIRNVSKHHLGIFIYLFIFIIVDVRASLHAPRTLANKLTLIPFDL